MYCSQCREQRSSDPELGDVERVASLTGAVEYKCTGCTTVLETTYQCGPCGGEKFPSITLNGVGQIVRTCPTCQTPMGLALSKPLAGTGKAIGAENNETVRPTEFIAPGDAIARGTEHRGGVTPPQRTMHFKDAAHRAPAEPVSHPALSTATDIESVIRTRLSFLDAQIAERKGLEIEAKTLRKTLKAFERATAAVAARTRISTLMAVSAESTAQN